MVLRLRNVASRDEETTAAARCADARPALSRTPASPGRNVLGSTRSRRLPYHCMTNKVTSGESPTCALRCP